MRLRLLGLLFIGVLCLGFTSNVLAQEADEWFVAWTIDGQLVSYTPDGETHVLIPENISANQFRVWRMDDDSLLLLAELNDIEETQILYQVTQTTATPITIAEKDVRWFQESSRLEMVANSATHAVLVAGENFQGGKALLVNLADHSAALLADKVMVMPVQAAAFSEDGLYLRYLRSEQDKEETWTLRELKLETGEERVFFTVEGNAFPIMDADQYGENWLYFYNNVSYEISRSGDVTTTEFENPEDRIMQRFVGDYRVLWPILCEIDCTLEWKRMPDGDTQIFPLPEAESGFIPAPIRQIGEDQLLIIVDSRQFWLLGDGSEPLLLGDWSPETIITGPDKILSPDGRWLLVLDDADSANSYRVLDLLSGETVLALEPERDYRILQIFYGEAGFIVSEDLINFQYYRTSDGQLFDLGEPSGTFWYVLADGDLLFNHTRNDERPRGIYRYNPDTEEYTLLLENAISLRVEDPTP